MHKKKEALADFVRRVRTDKRLSLMEVQRHSHGQIASSYVSRIENGYILNVTPKKLKALAKGLGVLEDEIFSIARGTDSTTYDTDEIYLTNMIEKYRQLSKEDKRELRLLIKVIDREVDRRARM